MPRKTPIILFVYKRLDALKQTVNALKMNEPAAESDLFIFSDAAKYEKDIPHVRAVRNYLSSVTGFRSVTIHESVTNKGLAASVIEGVTGVINKYGSAIVMEDDIITTKNFLHFMNEALDKYENEKKVCSISGYSFSLKKNHEYNSDAYFLNRGWSWGWATWKDRWNAVDWKVSDYEKFLSNSRLRKKFALGGSDLNSMLHKQMTGKIDSWAIRWFYHQFKTNTLTLYPLYSKAVNIGFDEMATHTMGSSGRYKPEMDIHLATHFSLPAEAHADTYFQKAFQNKMGIKARAISKIETILMRLLRA